MLDARMLMVTTHASCTRLFLLLCTNKAPDASSGVTKVAPSENDTSPMVINVATGRAGVSYGRVRWLMVALSGDYAPTQHSSQEHPSCQAGSIHQADPERHQPASTVWSSMTDGAPVWCWCSPVLHQVVVHLTTLHQFHPQYVKNGEETIQLYVNDNNK